MRKRRQCSNTFDTSVILDYIFGPKKDGTMNNVIKIYIAFFNIIFGNLLEIIGKLVM